MVLKAIFPSASGQKKEGGALIRGGALTTENTVIEKHDSEKDERNRN